jgi:hypothetical protein
MPTFPVGGAIKTAFVKCLTIGESRSPIMTSHGERGIWQRRYWEHTIRDDRDFAAHMDYTHFNPVKHGVAEHPADSLHSSFRRCVDGGLYPDGWRGGSDEPRETGERLSDASVEASGRIRSDWRTGDPTTMVEAECATLFRPTLAAVHQRASPHRAILSAGQ